MICDRFEADPEDPKGYTAINPAVLVEVLSPSTEDYDRGEKLDHYRRWCRGADAWALVRFEGDEDVTLESLGCAISVAQIYRDPLAG